MKSQARYDIAVNTPPIGYQPTPTRLMFGQMWEKAGERRLRDPADVSATP
jgi:hypothetical protein